MLQMKRIYSMSMDIIYNHSVLLRKNTMPLKMQVSEAHCLIATKNTLITGPKGMQIDAQRYISEQILPSEIIDLIIYGQNKIAYISTKKKMTNKKIGYILSIVVTIPILFFSWFKIEHWFILRHIPNAEYRRFLLPIVSFIGIIINTLFAFAFSEYKTLRSVFWNTLKYCLTSLIGAIVLFGTALVCFYFFGSTIT